MDVGRDKREARKILYSERYPPGTIQIGFPDNESSMVRRWLHDLEPVNYLENLGHIDRCACSHEPKAREHTLKEKY